jgi:membrane-associated phospholipid phosphatase
VNETNVLLALHRAASPSLDAVFVASHYLGAMQLGLALCLAMALLLRLKGQRREALSWILLGLAVLAAVELVKPLVARPRPALWRALVAQGGYSFPSGHALSTAAFYPLLAWLWGRRDAARAPVAWGFAIAVPLYVGAGRLYLGLHWPSDVLAGWAFGGLLSGLAVAWLRRAAPTA